MSIRLKTILGIAAIEAVLVFLLIASNLAFLRDSNVEQLDKRARTSAELFAAVAKADMLSLDLASLESQVELLARDPAIERVAVISSAHGVLAERAKSQAGHGEYLVRAKADVSEAGVIIGRIEITVSDEGIGQIMANARKRALVVGALGMTLSALFSAALGTYLTRQLSRLTEASKALAAGRLDHRIDVRGRDELAKVAQAFNRMSEELAQGRDELERRIRERTEELARSNELLTAEAAERRQAHRDLSQLLSAVSSILIGLDMSGLVGRWNKAAEEMLGVKAEEAIGRDFLTLPLSWEKSKVASAMARCRESGEPAKVNDLWYERGDGRDGFLVLTVSQVPGPDGDSAGLLVLGEEVTDLRVLEAQLGQAQKLESIGQLAAGIAHEINTPTQYIGDNLHFLREAYEGLIKLVNQCVELPEARRNGIDETRQRIDLDFLLTEAPQALAHSIEGVERVSSIVTAMKRFAHPGAAVKKPVDVNKAVENTAIVSRNEWKYVADLTTDLDPDLPLVVCLPGDVNQVLLNVVVNAAHAVAETHKQTGEKGRIAITTRRDGDFAVISVADTGPGIPEAARGRIFDPFFTTKEVGKGSGQGLTISYDIVVNKHGGSIEAANNEGPGATFTIKLPIGG